MFSLSSTTNSAIKYSLKPKMLKTVICVIILYITKKEKIVANWNITCDQ